VSLAVLGAASRTFVDGWDGLMGAVGGLLVGLACLLGPFLLGGMGGGDVKLMAAVGTCLGVRGAVYAVVDTALAGGVLALGALARHRFGGKSIARHARPAEGARESTASAPAGTGGRLTVPYGLAIAVGTLAAAWFGWPGLP